MIEQKDEHVSRSDLHLPNLTIRRFRGIQYLSMERLGRVTLIAGRNGVGKTTVLDAVRAYAARGHFSVLSSILRNREEITKTIDEDGEEVLAPNWDALIYGRLISPGNCIAIGPGSSPQQLTIKAGPMTPAEALQWARFLPNHLSDEDARVLRVTVQGKEQATPLFVFQSLWRGRLPDNQNELPSGIRCESLGPSVLDNKDIARFWDKVALTDSESRAVEALRLVLGDTVERAAIIGDDETRSLRYSRRAFVRIAGQERPVPLRSLGDGAVRLFGVALALANSKDGFLLIDEAENGLHYSIQRDFWRMVLLTAQENNVQVFATTHSWDCAAGFAQAAVEAEGVEGALVRLDSDGENIRAVEYSERQLHVAAEQGIEVR